MSGSRPQRSRALLHHTLPCTSTARTKHRTGPAEISLTAFGVSRPVSSATEQRLLPLLFSRAREHKL